MYTNTLKCKMIGRFIHAIYSMSHVILYYLSRFFFFYYIITDSNIHDQATPDIYNDKAFFIEQTHLCLMIDHYIKYFLVSHSTLQRLL